MTVIGRISNRPLPESIVEQACEMLGMLMLRLIAVGYFLPVTTVKGTVRCLDKSVIASVLKCFCFGVFESIVRIKQVLALG